MTPRNLILTSLAHQQPSRVPVDFGGHRSSGIAAIAYAKLRDYLSLPERPIRVYDIPQQLAVIDEDVLDRFGVDTIELGRGFALDDQDWADWVLPNGTPCKVPVWIRPKRDGNRWVLRSPKTGIEIAHMPDKSLYFEQTHLRNLERFLGEVGGRIDIILFGDDLGGQGGPLISPAMYREFFKKRHARLFKRAKELAPGIKVLLHCCGGVRDLLPDLIEAGLDAINPVQITCRGMEAAGLKRDFGRDLTFWGGGCDTRDILPNGTPAKIREHVLRQLEIFSPGGGYVFQQVHNIMADVPPENIVAMFDAVREFST